MQRDNTANTAAAIVIMRSMLKLLEGGSMHVETLEAKDGETLSLKVECLLRAQPDASEPDDDVPQPESCPECGDTSGVRDGGKVHTDAGLMLDRLCIRCHHVWQVIPPEE